MNDPAACAAPAEADFIRDLRVRAAAHGGVFTADEGLLAVIDPDAARQINGVNWHRYALPDRLIDLLRRRTSTRVEWKYLRVAWLKQLHTLTTPEHTAAIADRLAQLVETRLGAPTDLVVLAQDWVLDTLVPVALTGLSEREARYIRRDLEEKLLRLMAREPRRRPWQIAQFVAAQLRAGLVVRRVLRQRAAGRRPRELDLADPIVDLLPELGMDRALGAVTTVITAIGGPPIAAAVSVLYELARHPAWADRLTAELSALDPAVFYADPVASAPTTHRFVKEVLRMWSPPLLLVRVAQREVQVADRTLQPGDQYLLGAYLIHRSPQYWKDPDTFDPDRWLPGAPHGPQARGRYVPFGWAPKGCIGADIGTIHLMLICHLMCTRYRLEVPDAQGLEMGYLFAAVPKDFIGTVHRRDPAVQRT